jgi:hypothetical protein
VKDILGGRSGYGYEVRIFNSVDSVDYVIVLEVIRSEALRL